MAKFIYNGKEYVPTGRQAVRTNQRKKIDEALLEIRPADVDKDEKQFNIWVKEEDLFVITMMDTDDEA